VTQPTALLNLHTGQRFTLYTLTTLGRDLSNQIILNSPAAAPRHAEIRYEGGRFILYDLSGGFGAFVNGRQIVGPNMLKVGFRVRVGDVEFEVV
jgi:pSer/pThr/pTyr-binding forkhead associated (FHA) protein